jgi:predicted O-methyltransferase YrrM
MAKNSKSSLKESIEALLASPPTFHTWDGGETWDAGGFVPLDLQWLLKLCGNYKSPRIIETGAGLSTVIFLLANPAEVVTIAPDKALRNRIFKYLKQQEISDKRLNFMVAKSEDALPRLSPRHRFDLALIDGAHGWPNPFVDLCYINPMLKVGGTLIVDDAHIHSVGELVRFLSRQPGWVVSGGAPNQRTVAFTKLEAGEQFGDFDVQPYVTEMMEGKYFGFANYGLKCDESVFDFGSLRGGRIDGRPE